jgi:hypothetical protein
MKKFISALLMSVLFFTTLAMPFNVYAKKGMCLNRAACNTSALNLQMLQRRLWIEHVLWTRSFLTSNLANLEDKEAVLERLLKNQDDIGNSIKPYYGEELGNKLSSLLRDHIAIAGQVVEAAKTGNQQALSESNKLWHSNADQIVDFLSSINPNWSSSALRDIFYQHLALITEEVTARLNMDFKAAIRTSDKGVDHMVTFADILSSGIIDQFLKKSA